MAQLLMYDGAMPTVLRLDYEIREKNGAVLESSAERGPLEFVPGRRRLLPALEEVITKLKVGDEATGELPAARAFGDESLLPTMEIPRGEFPEGELPESGKKYEARTAGGEDVRFRVLSTNEKFVFVRLIHPLADKDIQYRLKLLAVEQPHLPPPVPGHVLGIDSAAIVIEEERSGPAS
jgi:FKBP-type peptidyl-prolyl cis-trans isomerase 2